MYVLLGSTILLALGLISSALPTPVNDIPTEQINPPHISPDDWPSNGRIYRTVENQIIGARITGGLAAAGLATTGTGVGLKVHGYKNADAISTTGGAVTGVGAGLTTFFNGQASTAADHVQTAQAAEIEGIKGDRKEMREQERDLRSRTRDLFERSKGSYASIDEANRAVRGHIAEHSPDHQKLGYPARAFESSVHGKGILAPKKPNKLLCKLTDCFGSRNWARESLVNEHDKRLSARGASTPFEHDHALLTAKQGNLVVKRTIDKGLWADGIHNQVGFRDHGPGAGMHHTNPTPDPPPQRPQSPPRRETARPEAPPRAGPPPPSRRGGEARTSPSRAPDAGGSPTYESLISRGPGWILRKIEPGRKNDSLDPRGPSYEPRQIFHPLAERAHEQHREVNSRTLLPQAQGPAAGRSQLSYASQGPHQQVPQAIGPSTASRGGEARPGKSVRSETMRGLNSHYQTLGHPAF